MNPQHPMASGTVFAVLARHGETRQPNPQGRYTSRPGPPLTGRGRAQARRLGESLRPFRVGGLYCSDLHRAQETAALVADSVGVTPHPVAAFREVHSGSLNGCTVEEVERNHPRFLPWIYGGHHQQFATADAHVPHDLGFPDGESVAEAAARAIPAFAELCSSSLGSLIVVVSHAWVTQALICHVLGIPISAYFRVASGYAAASVVQVDADGRGMLHCLNGGIPLEEVARRGLPRAEPVDHAAVGKEGEPTPPPVPPGYRQRLAGEGRHGAEQ